MRVLHFSKSDGKGGAARAAFRIHQSLKEAGLDSCMIVGEKTTDDDRVFGPKGLVGNLLKQAVPHLDEIPLRLGKKDRTKYRSAGFASQNLVAKSARFERDVVHLHWIAGGFMSTSDLYRLSNKPMIWRLADMWPFAGSEHYVGESRRYQEGYSRLNRPIGERGWDVDRWIWERKMRAIKNIPNLTVVAPSSWMAKTASESLIFRNRRIELIHTGNDVHLFKPFPKDLARDRFGLPQDRDLILFAADRPLEDSRKGFSNIVEALKSLNLNNLEREVNLVILGAKKPSEQPRDFNIPVHYLGRLEDELSLALAYSVADSVLVPSVEENLANTAIEAMACGVPVVAFDIGGMSDLVVHKENGYLATAGDPREFGAGIEWVLEDEKRKAALSKRARVTVEKKFSLESQLSMYLRLLDDIA